MFKVKGSLKKIKSVIDFILFNLCVLFVPFFIKRHLGFYVFFLVFFRSFFLYLMCIFSFYVYFRCDFPFAYLSFILYTLNYILAIHTYHAYLIVRSDYLKQARSSHYEVKYLILNDIFASIIVSYFFLLNLVAIDDLYLKMYYIEFLFLEPASFYEDRIYVDGQRTLTQICENKDFLYYYTYYVPKSDYSSFLPDRIKDGSNVYYTREATYLDSLYFRKSMNFRLDFTNPDAQVDLNLNLPLKPIYKNENYIKFMKETAEWLKKYS